MYHHVKKLMYTVNVGEPDPRFGNMLLEQFGGANGELAAVMQYTVQGINTDDPGLKDLLMDIGTKARPPRLASSAEYQISQAGDQSGIALGRKGKRQRIIGLVIAGHAGSCRRRSAV
jgi:Manganese containing catalase